MRSSSSADDTRARGVYRNDEPSVGRGLARGRRADRQNGAIALQLLPLTPRQGRHRDLHRQRATLVLTGRQQERADTGVETLQGSFAGRDIHCAERGRAEAQLRFQMLEPLRRRPLRCPWRPLASDPMSGGASPSHHPGREGRKRAQRRQRRQQEQDDDPFGDARSERAVLPRTSVLRGKSDEPPSFARTTSSRLAFAVSGVELWPSFPTLYKSNSLLSGLRKRSLRAFPFPFSDVRSVYT